MTAARGTNARLRENRKNQKRNHRWVRVYRHRMREGLEQCRNRSCVRRAQTFGHLIPHCDGGTFSLENITLLCLRCNASQANQVWLWLIPLIEEPGHAELMRTSGITGRRKAG